MTTATMTLGQHFRTARGATSIREVARRAGLSEGAVRNYESERVTRPVPATVARIARVVRANVRQALVLAGFDPDQYPDLIADRPSSDAIVAAFDEWFHDQSRRDRETTIGHLVALHATLANLEE